MILKKYQQFLLITFPSLYLPKDHVNFDGNFKTEIENKRKLFETNEENNSDLFTCPVELSELKVCLKDLKKRKSPGADNISNEHLIHGGPALLQSLQKLYCKMIELEVIPDKGKVGILFQYTNVVNVPILRTVTDHSH